MIFQIVATYSYICTYVLNAQPCIVWEGKMFIEYTFTLKTHLESKVFNLKDKELAGMVWHGRTLHGMVWTVKLITVWFEAAPPPAGHTSPPARTNHLTVKQRCRCTPAKNQPQTNDFRLRAGLHEMHLVFWRAPWSSKVLHCSSRFQCSWWLMMVGGFRLFIWSKWIWNFKLTTG